MTKRKKSGVGVPITGIQVLEFASLLGVGGPRVHTFIKKGMPTEEDGSVGFDSAIQWVEDYVRNSEVKVVAARKEWKKGVIQPGSVTPELCTAGAPGEG